MPEAVRHTWLWLSVITLSVALSGLLSAGMLLKALTPLSQKLNSVSPVAVVDFAQVVLALGPDASPEQIEAALSLTHQRIRRLREAGFVVLDAQAVVDADPTLYLPTVTTDREQEITDAVDP